MERKVVGIESARRGPVERHITGILAVWTLLALASCGPNSFTSYSYRDVVVDLEKLTVTPIAPLGIGTSCPAAEIECYSRLTDARGRQHINHHGPPLEPGSPGRRISYNSFTAAHDYRLSYRTKYQLLLAGSFGHVYAVSTYYYSPDYAGQRNTIEVKSYLSNVSYEPPENVASIPADAKLTAVSVVRVLRHPPEFLVLSADYGPRGDLWAFHVNAVAGGEWTNLPEASKQAGLGVGVTTIGDRSPHRKEFGLPHIFPTDTYAAAPHRVWQPTKHPEHLSVVTLHYEGNRWALQHSFTGDNLVDTRRLRFRATREDTALAPLDAARGFGR